MYDKDNIGSVLFATELALTEVERDISSRIGWARSTITTIRSIGQIWPGRKDFDPQTELSKEEFDKFIVELKNLIKMMTDVIDRLHVGSDVPQDSYVGKLSDKCESLEGFLQKFGEGKEGDKS